MSTGKHGDVLPLIGIELQLIDETAELGEEDALHSLTDQQREGRVVDVLRGESEVDELLLVTQP